MAWIYEYLFNLSLFFSDLTRVASRELVSRPDLVLTSLRRPGLTNQRPAFRSRDLSGPIRGQYWGPGERLCVTAPAPAMAYTRPLHYTVVGVDSANNTGAVSNIVRVSMQWEPRPESRNAATVQVRKEMKIL